MTNYVYILQEREFIRLNEPTYKIGKTGKNPPWERIKQYPKGTVAKFLMEVDDKDKFETKAINIFKNKYKQMTDYGNEYFQGNLNEMIQDFVNIKNNTNVEVIKQILEPINPDNIELINYLNFKLNDYGTMKESEIECCKKFYEDRNPFFLKRQVRSLERNLRPLKETICVSIEEILNIRFKRIAIERLLQER